MRKSLFVIGLVLLLIGIIFAFSAVHSENIIIEQDTIVKSEVDSWQISSSFVKGQKIKLVIDRGVDWEKYIEPPVEDVPLDHKFVFVNITPPSGEDSMFEVAYAKYQDLFGIYHVKIVASNGFDAKNSSGGIVGYVKETGLHTATVLGSLPPGGGPPSALTFFEIKEVTLTIYPYSYLLYPSVAVLLAGIVLTIIGKITSKRVQPRKIRTKSRQAKRFFKL